MHEQSPFAFTVARLDGAAAQCQTQPSVTGTEQPGWFTPMDGKTHEVRLDRTGTALTTDLRATGLVRARVARNSWGVRKAEVSASLAVSATPRSPHVCSVMWNSLGGVAMNTRISKRSWLVVRSSRSATGYSEGGVEIYGPSVSSSAIVPAGRSLDRLVPPGDYGTTSYVTSMVTLTPNTAATASARATFKAMVALLPVGTRRSLRGTARGLVTPGHRSCTDNRVRVAFSDAARNRTRQITFYVNGDRRVVLRGRALQRSSILLSRIAPRSDGVVKAVVIAKSGARRTMRSTSWPCR